MGLEQAPVRLAAATSAQDIATSLERLRGPRAVVYYSILWAAVRTARTQGPWTGYDWAAVLSGETRRAADRDYWIEYPGGLRPWVAGSFIIGRSWRAMARVDNPGNATGPVRTNVSAPVGRLVVLGMEARWR